MEKQKFAEPIFRWLHKCALTLFIHAYLLISLFLHALDLEVEVSYFQLYVGSSACSIAPSP